MKIVEIIYRDITQVENKTTKGVKKEVCKVIKAVGHLIHEDEKNYKIVYNYDTCKKEEEHDALIIPKGCVIEFRVLKYEN
jgi:hypothetical protein